jgi:ATP-dependent phosphoenolpyruvate carboxykinase
MTGGAYGTSRMKLKYTRSMITAALNGELDNVAYKNHVVLVLLSHKNVLTFLEILNPRNTWEDKDLYDQKRVWTKYTQESGSQGYQMQVRLAASSVLLEALCF